MKYLSARIAVVVVALTLLLTGCKTNNVAQETTAPVVTDQLAPEPTIVPTPEVEETAAPTETPAETPGVIAEPFTGTVRVATLKGPTGMGMARLMSQNENLTSINPYEFTIVNSPDEIVGLISSGSVDVAAIPTNLAATLYNKTNGKIQVAAINTLGVLHIVSDNDEVKSIADLNGKTLHATGQGSVPEFALNYLLEANQVKEIKIEWHADHAELTTLMAAGKVSLGMLPEPNVTTAISKNNKLKAVVDLSAEWHKKQPNSELAMGCIVISKDFADHNSDILQNFLSEYSQSIAFTNDSPADAAVFIEKYGIVPSAEIAESAIKRANIVFINDAKMKTILSDFYQILFDAEPKSVGGKLPDDAFYFVR